MGRISLLHGLLINSNASRDLSLSRHATHTVRYQIGSWTHVSYEHPHGFQALVRYAAANLQPCATHLGNRFTDIVLSCLTDRKYHNKFSVSIPTTEVHEWPRYGTKDQSHRLQESIEEARSKRNDLPRVGLKGKRPMNEVLEIMHYVIVPLRKLVNDLKVFEDPDVVMTSTASESQGNTEASGDHHSLLGSGNSFLEKGEWSRYKKSMGNAESNGGNEAQTNGEEESEPRPQLIRQHTYVESAPESSDQESPVSRSAGEIYQERNRVKAVSEPSNNEGPVVEEVD